MTRPTPLTLVLLSDTHARHREVAVPDGDVFLYAGDITWRGELDTVEDFDDWLGTLPHRHKVVICGNHDWCFEREPDEARKRITNAVYLQDTGVEIGGLKIWGSPWQPWFFSWAFNLHRGEPIAAKWKLIPDDTDVLITHGPPHGIGDRCFDDRLVGCTDLLARIRAVKPKLHLCGHIHEAAGAVEQDGTLFVNASSLTEVGVRPATVVTWDGERMTVA
jgi:Icc-related predicted phosphoesterase